MIKWLRRYVSVPFLVGLAFVGYVLFINDNSMMRSLEYASEIRALEAKIEQLEDTLALYQSLNRSLDSNPEELERIVREHYRMQRASEDVYIIQQE